MTLDFQIMPTYNTKTINIIDTSVYDTVPPILVDPVFQITIPGGFDPVFISYQLDNWNILDSTVLEITEEGSEPLPDGIYTFKYMAVPNHIYVAEKTMIRVEALQEKFDEAFMRLDMMQCDQALKRQEKLKLNTVEKLIQGSIASANNCATLQAIELYRKADSLLTSFIKKSVCCGEGTNLIHFN